ncbi:peptidase M16 [Fervidicella metallireducens AeB]|uniref:Peptidase M16 n=1 Tax=Fervidicella metallireducens AeB TaxID=1403537 RepID=A0A017RZ93_9CLOT|nr:insulinase family protein [Fervidicella metallireducens]EYE89260.1 peptidase M16 [Fervidicella metallireducens AeB]
MSFKKGMIYSGFQLTEEVELNEINSIGRLFNHLKSGARLFAIQNGDDNKVFSITFRTPPDDNTGLTHILEHSVLCGSRKFPVKDPFVELAKGSLNTFLNAMTFPDKTMYPVASRNEKDFLNLMDVYLDAVFYPRIYSQPEIFMQEGWHYSLENEKDEIEYKGVVYNEMKGAFLSPESLLFRKARESVFPDTPYKFEAGGDPDYIPSLTYKHFVDYHDKYYHPSNSYIYLYGDFNLNDKLKFLDEKYLRYFDKKKIDSDIKYQEGFDKIKDLKFVYPISPEEDVSDKTYFALNFATTFSTDVETNLALEILEYLLMETQASPLKKALISANLGKDVIGSYNGGILQPIFTIAIKNSNIEKKNEFINLVYKTLNELVQNGIDKELIEASINRKEFNLREGDYQGYPKGLLYGIKSMDTWLYDKEPWLPLQYEKLLVKIKKGLSLNYFEELINKYILNNSHASIITLFPQKGFYEEKLKKLKEKLSEYKKTLSASELSKIIEDTERLKQIQEAQDDKDDVEKIPLLKISDINRNAEKLPIIESYEKDIKILFHPILTNKISYARLLFNTKGVPIELIQYVTLLSGILGKLNTKKYNYTELANLINIYSGGVGFKTEVYIEKGDDEIYHPKFTIEMKFMNDKITTLFELVENIIVETNFNDKQRLKEIIQEIKSRLEMSLYENGHMVAASRLVSYFSPSGKYIEITTGLSFYKFIVDLEKNFNNKSEEIIKNLIFVSKVIFNKSNLIISFTSSEEDYDALVKNLPLLLRNLKNEKVEEHKYEFILEAENEGLILQSGVQYVAKGFNYIKLGFNYSGSIQVLKGIINLDYLWNRVRLQGGAYGCFGVFEKGGNMYFTSYRDPNLSETLDVYNKVYEFIKNFNVNDREMTKYIIGTISKLDYPLSPAMRGQQATANYLRKITYDDIQRERDEILNTNQKKIREYSELLFEVMHKDYICVVGNEEKLNETNKMFKKIINVIG